MRLDDGAVIDISGLVNGGTSFGSLLGTGQVLLGANRLTVGGNGLDTTVGGLADGGVAGGTGGSLQKVGPGTLRLQGPIPIQAPPSSAPVCCRRPMQTPSRHCRPSPSDRARSSISQASTRRSAPCRRRHGRPCRQYADPRRQRYVHRLFRQLHRRRRFRQGGGRHIPPVRRQRDLRCLPRQRRHASGGWRPGAVTAQCRRRGKPCWHRHGRADTGRAWGPYRPDPASAR